MPGSSSGPSATFTLAALAAASDEASRRAWDGDLPRAGGGAARGVRPDQVRVLVTDELTGRPLRGRVVAVADVAGGITSTGGTDEGGVATVHGQGPGEHPAFHADYGYLTLAHYDRRRARGMCCCRCGATRWSLYGGAKGTFRDLPSTSNLHLGFAGLSMPGLGLELAPSSCRAPRRRCA